MPIEHILTAAVVGLFLLMGILWAVFQKKASTNYADQLAQSARQQERTAALLDRWEKHAERVEAILDRIEKRNGA